MKVLKRKTQVEVKQDDDWVPGVIDAARGNDVLIIHSRPGAPRSLLKISDEGETWRLANVVGLGN